MKRILIILILAFGAISNAVTVTADTPAEKKDIRFDPESETVIGRPKKPAYCPFAGVMDEYSITLFSTVSGEVEITITDSTGMPVYEDAAELYEGYVIPLEEGIDYSLLYLTIGSRTYKAVL